MATPLVQPYAHLDFDDAVAPHTGGGLRADDVEILQVNVGLRCNLECHHCHVVSGPNRTEEMSWDVMAEILRVADAVRPKLVDITGGAPEMNREFRRFVAALRAAGHAVQVRTNLTIFFAPGYDWVPEFLRDRQVQLVASLPCYLEDNVDRQRGDGVYRESVEAIRWLNRLGYGVDPALTLDLVYNPGGASLPPPQQGLEADYKAYLNEHFGLRFNRLFVLTNMPIGRFRADLKREGRYDEYMATLAGAFNPATIEPLMCRHQIEVAWDGTLYDCDFHLAHHLPIDGALPRHIRDFDPTVHAQRPIVTCDYCFGCTAGAGSSCGGALV